MNTAKREQRAETRCTIKAAIEIKSIANQLFEQYRLASKEIGIHVPSMTIAVDYLLVCAAMNGELTIGKLTSANNLYLQICKEV